VLSGYPERHASLAKASVKPHAKLRAPRKKRAVFCHSAVALSAASLLHLCELKLENKQKPLKASKQLLSKLLVCEASGIAL